MAVMTTSAEDLEVLAAREPVFHRVEFGASAEAFEAMVAPDLATYQLAQGERLTRRASIWRETPSGWQIVYHQGTVMAG